MKILLTLALLSSIALGYFICNGGVETAGNESIARDVIETKNLVGTESQKVPIAEVTHTVFDFGLREPGRVYDHIFDIKNTGDADLRLRKGAETCKCITLEVLDPVVLPGETGQVRLMWDSRDRSNKFREGVQLRTNDPKHATIDFFAKGELLVLAQAKPDNIDIGTVEISEAFGDAVKIYSQRWKNFFVHSLTSSKESMSYQILPLSPSELSEVNAQSGVKLLFSYSETKPQSIFRDQLVIQCSNSPLKPSASNGIEREVAEVNVEVNGKVAAGYTILNEHIDYFGSFAVGSLRADKDHEFDFLMKVSADIKRLKLVGFSSEPPGLEIDFTPVSEAKGVYRWSLKFPAGIQPADYNIKGREGSIDLIFDHPTISTVKIPFRGRLYLPSSDVEY